LFSICIYTIHFTNTAYTQYYVCPEQIFAPRVYHDIFDNIPIRIDTIPIVEKRNRTMKYIFHHISLLLLCAVMLTAQQKQPSKLYRLDGKEIQYSTDAGANWERLALPFDKAPTAFSWDAKAPARLLVGIQGGIYRSIDAGRTWHCSLIRTSRFTPLRFYVSQKNHFRVYCAGSVENASGAATELWQSMNGGAAWTRRPAGSQPPDSFSVDPGASTRAAFPGKRTIQTAAAKHSAASQTSSNNILWHDPIMLSDSGCDSFSPRIALSEDDIVQTTWVTTHKIKFPYRRSTDGGNTFEPVKEMLHDSVQYPYSAYHPFVVSDLNKVFLFFIGGQSGGGMEPLHMIRSFDAGTTWEDIRVISNDTTGVIIFVTMNGDSLLISYFAWRDYTTKYLVSGNGGDSWETLPLKEQYDYTRFAITPGNIHTADNDWGMSSAAEVMYFRSTDFGQTWRDSIMLSSFDGWFSDVWTIDGKERNGVTEVWSAWRDVKYGHYGDLGADIIIRSRVDSAAWFPEQLMTEQPQGTESRLSTNGKNRAITWWNEIVAYESTVVMVRASQNSLWNFSPVTNITPYRQAGWPIVKVSSRAIHVVWEEQDGDIFHIYYRKGEFPVIDAHLALAESSLVIDTTEVASSRIDTLHFANTGTDTLTIGSIVSDNDNFSVAPAETVLAPGEHGVITVMFSPVTSGVKQGKIILYSDAATSPDVVPVTGMAAWREVAVSYFQSGWNLLSSPVQPPKEFSLPSLFQWDHGYRSCDTMQAGRGYWAKPLSPVIYYGTPKSADTIDVKKGWNIVGPLEQPLPATSVTTDPLGNTDSFFYGYSVIGYAQSDTLKPGFGYWVKMKQDGKLMLQGTSKK
jgi:photosystem II stability/assembly factor-like uncharacterized protein